MSPLEPVVQPICTDFELDRQAGELRASGHAVRLPEQLFRLLALMVDRSGQVVTRDEIRAILWSDRYVNFDDSINSAIKRLRQCLEDAAINPRLIKTLPSRGYRFAIPTEPIQPVIKGKVDCSMAAEPRLAVLPFRNLSGNPADEDLAAGLTGALVTALTKVPKLRIVSRRAPTSGMGQERAKSAIGRMMKVDALVHGSVLRSGDRVRVTVQLLNVSSEEYLWAENYDYQLRDILAFHADVSGAMADNISGKLVPGEKPRVPAPAHVRRPAAYQAFLKGHLVFKHVTDEGLIKARHYWKKAVHEDPQYAKAWAGLAESYNMLAIAGLLPPQEAIEQARVAATKALEMDDSLSEAHTALAFTRMVNWDWEGAGRDFQRALELDPNFTTGNPCHYVEYLLAIGRPETAVADLERAQEMQPLSIFLSVILGWTYYGARQYDKAIRQHRRVVEIEPHFGMARWCLGLDYVQKRKYKAAIHEFQQARLSGGPYIASLTLGHAYAMAGDRDRALQIVRESKKDPRRTYSPPYAIAAIYAGLGDYNASFEFLAQAVKAHDIGLIWLKWDPQFDALRSDPRFSAILAQIGVRPHLFSTSAAD